MHAFVWLLSLNLAAQQRLGPPHEKPHLVPPPPHLHPPPLHRHPLGTVAASSCCLPSNPSSVS
uniref:Uncharacterized protein n=1 Tax=Arundo donax TaxID=35708 RepID=A0A0A9CWH8_ARUDO